MANDLLIEILCEELPPKSLLTLSRAFKEGIEAGLRSAKLDYDKVVAFPSPRRLALRIEKLSEQQPDQTLQKQGPSASVAFDKEGVPTKAALGFAKGLGVSVDALSRLKTDKGEWLTYTVEEKGLKTVDMIGAMIDQALTKLPVPKPMRWGGGNVLFVRPVHRITVMYGTEIVKTNILGINASNQTLGHRFHHPELITLASANDYESELEKAYVLASFEKRKARIVDAVTTISAELNATPVMDEDLLEEITNIVEWPVPLLGQFDKQFLDVPAEVLVTSMAQHQKYIALKDKKGALLPHFIVVANIVSKDEQRVIQGNEKVICARLSDAAFFYEKDKETTLLSKTDKLSTVIFQKKLGSLQDKVVRVGKLASTIAGLIDADSDKINRAVTLSKADLMSEMVGEFPALQGVMGEYYAAHDKEDPEVGRALFEQYLPRYSGDTLPETQTGTVLALAERIDTLVGIFGINQKPTGVKDPFKCRRLALGIVRILLEEKNPLDLNALLSESHKHFECDLPNQNVIPEVHQFIVDRLKVYFTSQGVRHDVVNAVLSVESNSFNAIEKRIEALQHFVASEHADSLASAFKRVRKLFEKEKITDTLNQIDESLFEADSEETLYHAMQAKKEAVTPLLAKEQYKEVLEQLAMLKEPVDAFFDGVMVLAEDKQVKANRLALLSSLEQVFMQVADLSELQ